MLISTDGRLSTQVRRWIYGKPDARRVVNEHRILPPFAQDARTGLAAGREGREVRAVVRVLVDSELSLGNVSTVRG